MKILTFIGVISSLAALTLGGCTKSPDEGQSGDQMVAVKVGADISTRAVGTLWNDNDAIGITMFNHGTYDLAEGNCVNRKYSIFSGASGVFNASDNNSIIYFPKNGAQADFVAYYPYTSSVSPTYVVPINVSDQTSLPKIDFMTAKNTVGASKDNPGVQFHFSHKLSKIIVVLQTQTGDPSRLIGSRITLKGVLTKASCTLTDNALSIVPDATSGANFDIIPNSTGAQAEGIVLPRAAGAGVDFEIALTDGSVYTAHMSSTLALTSGYQYTFYITLNRTPIEVSADILPWNVGPNSNLSALAVTTTVNASSGVTNGNVMRVYTGSTLLGSYTYSSSTGLWATASPVYWENLVGSSVVFKAAINPVAALNGTQLPDILVADPVSVARDNGVNFVIRHAASKVTVVLTSNDGSFSTAELNSATLTLPSYKAGGVETNGLFVPGATTQDITLSGGMALFQPQVISAGSNLVTVTINGKNYYAKAPVGGITYTAGEARKITIDLLKVNILVSATVVDWTTGQDISLQSQYVTITTPNASSVFVSGNSIDLFVLNNTGVSSKFTYQVNGTWTPTTPIYWDNLTTLPIEVAAAFPSDLVVPINKIVHWSVYGNQSTGSAPSDLLVAYISSLAAGQPANLSFKHAMNKVQIVLQPGVGFTTATLSSATVVINSVPSVTNVNLTNLAVTGTSSYVDIIPYKDSNLNFSALIVPCTIVNGTKILTVTIGADSYPVTLNADMTFAATKVNKLTVTINKTPVGISATVESWGVGDNGGFTIE